MADTARNEVPLVAGISNNYTAGGMNFLQMLALLRQECGVSGSAPSSIAGATGEMARLAGYIRNAWLEIQTLHEDWQFMRQPVAFVLQANKQSYTSSEMFLSSFGRLKLDAFSIHTMGDATDEVELPHMEYDQFRRTYLFGAERTRTQRPTCFTVNSQGDLLVGSTPDKQYQIHGEAYAMPTALVNDADRPACPAQYHMAIVYKAMIYYALYEAAPEVLARGEAGYNKLIARMALHQLPQMTFGGPLA